MSDNRYKKKAPQYYIFDGNYSTFKPGEKARGLHLNKAVRDIMRACGYDCIHCYEANCFDGCKDDTVIGMLMARIEALERKLAE